MINHFGNEIPCRRVILDVDKNAIYRGAFVKLI